MKKFIILAMLISSAQLFAQNIFITKSANLHFFSSTIVEDIEAETNAGMSALDQDNKTLYFKVKINSFEFEKALMQEHFNENYMESDEFPHAEYNGNFITEVDWETPGTYDVELKGILEIHGVKVERTDNGVVTINEDGTIDASSKFIVELKDHDIDIPKILIKNIAEKVEVTVKGNYKLLN